MANIASFSVEGVKRIVQLRVFTFDGENRRDQKENTRMNDHKIPFHEFTISSFYIYSGVVQEIKITPAIQYGYDYWN